MDPQPSQIRTSIIRTVVPIAVAFIVTVLAKKGIDAGPWQDVISQAVGSVAGAVYYAVARWLEVNVRPKFGWLLGKPGAPTYQSPAKPDESSPSGYSATDTAPVPEDTPVEVVPVPADAPVVDQAFETPPGTGDGEPPSTLIARH